MRKKPGSLMIRAALFFLAVPGIPGMTVHGTEAGNGFVVTYENGKLEGDYSAGEIENEVSGMQPGDTASFGRGGIIQRGGRPNPVVHEEHHRKEHGGGEQCGRGSLCL